MAIDHLFVLSIFLAQDMWRDHGRTVSPWYLLQRCNSVICKTISNCEILESSSYVENVEDCKRK